MEAKQICKNGKYYDIRSYPDTARNKKRGYPELPTELFRHFDMDLSEKNKTPCSIFNDNMEHITEKIVINENDVFKLWDLSKDFMYPLGDEPESSECQDYLRQLRIEFPYNFNQNDNDDFLQPRCICGVKIFNLFKIHKGNDSVLIGSECIYRFGRDDWDKIVKELFDKYKNIKRQLELERFGEFVCWYCERKNSKGGMHKTHHKEIKKSLACSGKTKESFIDDMFDKVDLTNNLFCKSVYDYYIGTNKLSHTQASCTISNMEEKDRQYYKFLQEIKMIP